MTTKIIRVGISRGVFIPEYLSERSGIGPEAELALENKGIVIRPATGQRPGGHPREGWGEKFRQVSEKDGNRGNGNPKGQTDWDHDEWEW